MAQQGKVHYNITQSFIVNPAVCKAHPRSLNCASLTHTWTYCLLCVHATASAWFHTQGHLLFSLPVGGNFPLFWTSFSLDFPIPCYDRMDEGSGRENTEIASSDLSFINFSIPAATHRNRPWQRKKHKLNLSNEILLPIKSWAKTWGSVDRVGTWY